ncbi:MAG TPA: hypothetical protein VFA92_14225 [Candidatus Binatia bacterium]|nr:hypothetical protein [Candidatus Binatia bacterium]
MSEVEPPSGTDAPGDRPPPWRRWVASSRLRERRTLAIGGAGLLAVVLIGLIVFLAVRPTTSQPVSSATPAPTPSATPAPSATPSPSANPSEQQTAAAREQQRQRYRDYYTILVTNGTALAAATTQLRNCGRGNPPACSQAIGHIDTANVAFQQDLNKTPPPACLASANSQLRTGLELQQRSLDVASQGVSTREGLKMVQGMILFTAANYSIADAVRSGRQANCRA